jgi:glyoxylase-like metal-dependent hydrolase (beta-lactamase superfamily II)
MTIQIALPETALASVRRSDGHAHEVTPDLAYLRTVLVNVVMIGVPHAGAGRWVLIDTGIPGSAAAIRAAAAARFGDQAPPVAILMTHGHFDHVGALEELSRDWNVPIYAHRFEAPFLTGAEKYPPSDPKADGGIMAKLSPLFPRSPIDVGERLQVLPEDGSVPHLPGWQWLHTPGHTPGHVSFWNPQSRCLIAGDAFITTGQESAYEVAQQTLEMHGPPRYFTPDWLSAAASVRKLAALRPDLVITGHGRPAAGPQMLAALGELAENFETIAPPDHLRHA